MFGGAVGWEMESHCVVIVSLVAILFLTMCLILPVTGHLPHRVALPFPHPRGRLSSERALSRPPFKRIGQYLNDKSRTLTSQVWLSTPGIPAEAGGSQIRTSQGCMVRPWLNTKPQRALTITSVEEIQSPQSILGDWSLDSRR